MQIVQTKLKWPCAASRPMAFSRPLALLLAASLLGAGCIGKGGDDNAPDPVDPASLTPPTKNTTLPDDRGVCSGCAETNKTEEGVGGVDHKHDYWKGKETAELLKGRPIYLGPTPVYPDGEGTTAKSAAYVKLPCVRTEGKEGCEPMLVYEGAQKVLVTLREPVLSPGFTQGGEPVGAPHPSPPKLFLQYRSAADAEWREPIPVTYGTPVELSVDAKETDMPHSVLSLWVFRITTDQTASMYVKMDVTAVKGRDVVDWPGHPDFYADTTSRVVLNQHVKTKISGVKEGYLYDSGGTWIAPEKLISHGTGSLVVIANVTSIRSATGQTATGYFLESHNATYIGPELRFGDRWSDRDNTNDLKSYDFDVPVDVAGMDGPYQPQSRWGFRLMATFADIDSPVPLPSPLPSGIGLCPGCFEYEIEYDLVVIAVKATEPQAGMG